MSESDSAAATFGWIGERFGAVVAGVIDWDAATPVPQWQARDVVSHLTEWIHGLLSGGGVTGLTEGPSVADDPVAAWTHRAAEISALLDGEAAGASPTMFSNPHMGVLPLAEAIDRFYTPDVFMHTWDLAAASGQELPEDQRSLDYAASLLAGMEEIEQMLRDSGQFGPRRPVDPDAGILDRLAAFIGRTPTWTPRP